MGEFPFEHDAMNNEPLPPNLPMEDQLMYLSLRNLYASYRSGTISREQGSEEKGQLVYEYEKRKRIERTRSRGSKHTATMWISIAKYTHAYRKDRTLENADKLLEAIQGEVFGWEQMMEDE